MLNYERMTYDKDFTSNDKEKILINNFPLAFKVANNIKKDLKDSPVYDFEDVVQTSLLFLCKAFKNFDSSKNNKFSTYATAYCHGGVSNFLRNSNPVHLTHGAIERIGQYNKAKREDLSLTLEEFCKRNNYPLKEMKKILDCKDALSLDKTNEGGRDLFNIVQGGNFENGLCEKIDFQNALKQLTGEEREILKLRFCQNGCTRKELAEKKNITLGQMRWKEIKLTKKLKDLLSVQIN